DRAQRQGDAERGLPRDIHARRRVGGDWRGDATGPGRHGGNGGAVRIRETICLLAAAALAYADWPTFGGGAQRTGWARQEHLLNRDNVGTLELKWKIKLDNAPKELTSLTAPIVADQVKIVAGIKEYVVVAGSSDKIYAIDADTGKLAWQRTFD